MESYRTGEIVNDGRNYQPKATRSALTMGDYQELPGFTSAPVVDVPLPIVNRSVPSANTIAVPRNHLLNGDQLRGMFGRGKESPSEQFEAGYNPPPSKAATQTTTNAVRDQQPDYMELDGIDPHADPQMKIRSKRGG